MKTTHKLLVGILPICLLLASALPLSAQTSWGDQQPNGTRESTSTGLFSPSRQAFDSNINTAWQLSPGATSGWVERYWAAPQRISGAQVNLTLPQGSQLQFSYLGNGHWVPIPGAVITGPQNGVVVLNFPGDVPQTSKILTTLQGSAAQVWEIGYLTGVGPQPYGKIKPQSYTFNQNEYINLKPSRLWDGILDSPWFSPLWSLPSEAFQTSSPNQPTAIFPPYFGNPPQDGVVVWQLDGTYTVQTLKVFFVQNYQSVQFDFWDGSKWTNTQTFGAGWSDPGAGWQRIDLKTTVTTTKIRITFPGGWGRAQQIGEVEVWGQGTSDTTPQALAIPASDTDGSYHLTVNSAVVQDYQLEVTVGGATGSPLTGEWNGTPFTAVPSTWIGEDTVYRLSFPKESLRTEAQFLKLVPPGPLHGVVLKNGADHGLIDLGWPYSDGQVAATTAGVAAAVPQIKTQSWSLGGPHQLEKLRVYTASPNPGTFKTVLNGHSSSVTWTSQGAGWWEASLGGITADHFSFDSPTAITFDEIQLWGTPLIDTKVGLEIWWPKAGSTLTSGATDSDSVIGWMGDVSAQPLIGGYHPRQASYLFWMPLNQMGMAPGQQQTFQSQVGLGTLTSQLPWTVAWQGNQVPAVLDQGTLLASTTQASMTLSGSVKDSKALCFVNGAAVPIVTSLFNTSVVLKDGFQILDVQIWDKQKKKLEAEFFKPVYKTVNQPVVQFDQPAGTVWTQSPSMTLTGRVGNGLGLTLTMNGTAVPLSGNVLSQSITLGSGIQNFAFVLKDNAGRETDQTLTINQDSARPVIQIQTPTPGQYLASSLVTFNVAGSPDAQMWWQFNTEPWEPGYLPVKTKTYSLPDGFYTYTVTAQDRSGNLSSTAKVSFCVDTTPPLAFAISANVTGWTNNNRPTLTFATTDATSGVDHYEYLADTGAFATVKSPFQLPALDNGVHTVYVKAVDRAGNTTIENITLSIDTATPPTPINLTQTPGLTEVDLAWTSVPEPGVLASLPQTYRIERSPAWPDGIRTVAVPAYNDIGLTSGDTFQYRVTAVDVAGNLSVPTPWLSAEVGLASVPISATGSTTVNFNQASVTLPAGSTAPDVIGVQINQLPVQFLNDQPTNPLVSGIFQFRVTRTSSTGTLTTDHADFAAPVAIQLAYDPSKIPDGMTEANLKPFYYDTLWGRWLPVKGALVDSLNHLVYFQINHFTDFSVQATQENSVTPQQLRDVQFSPFGTAITHAPVTISGQGGVVSTAFTEFNIPGRNGFDLVIKRVYDSARAQSDATTVSSQASTAGLDPTKDGSYPWSLGPGWRLNFPFMKWNENSFWVTDLDGKTFGFGQAVLQPNPTGGNGADQKLTFINHESSDATLQVTLTSHAHY